MKNKEKLFLLLMLCTPAFAINIGDNVEANLVNNVYIITGNGKINKDKFKKLENIQNKKIKIKKGVLLPNDSTNLFDKFNEEIEIYKDIDTSNITDMGNMFSNTLKANPDVSNWNVSNVTDMQNMFYNAKNATPNVSRWNVSNVTKMQAMFSNTIKANPNVSNWNVGKVINMESMFEGALISNPDVTNWNVSNVTDFDKMFKNAKNANPNVSNWKLNDNVTMTSMFENALVADPDITNWSIKNINKFDNIFKNTPKFKEHLKKIGYVKDTELSSSNKNKISELSKLSNNIKIYEKYIDAFYYNDTSIIENNKKGLYFNLDYINLISKIVESINTKENKLKQSKLSLQFGYNKNITNDLLIGTFIQYDYNHSNNFGVGLLLNYNELESFIRYRLASYIKKYNHNIETYLGYTRDFKIDKFKITPKIGVYGAYSSSVYLTDYVKLHNKLILDLNLETKLSYQIQEKLEMYITPKIKLRNTNTQIISEVNRNNKFKKENAKLDYNLDLGINYYGLENTDFNFKLKLSGDTNNNMNLGISTGVKYIFD